MFQLIILKNEEMLDKKFQVARYLKVSSHKKKKK